MTFDLEFEKPAKFQTPEDKDIYFAILASINGIRIYDNQFIRNKDADKLIAGVANEDYSKPEISKIKAGNNSVIGP